MTVGAIVPRSLVLGKPRYGDPCTSCGLCCMLSLCPLAQAIYPERPVASACPALEWVEGKSACGLVAHPERHAATPPLIAYGRAELAATAKHLIGSGDGCDCHLTNEPPRAPEVIAKWTAQAARDRPRTQRAWNTWGFAWPP